MSELEATDLENRVHNLEIALVTLISIIDDELSTGTSESVKLMMLEFFESSSELGGFRKDTFSTNSTQTGK